jgi:hypothetical protein
MLAGASRDQKTSMIALAWPRKDFCFQPVPRRIGSLKPASVSFLKRFLENLPMTYPELFFG